jgi:hypothetical protein
MSIKQEIIDSLKSFEWDKIITKCNGLEDLNERQWRFAKGLIVELIVEKHSGVDGLTYVGKDHKDYDWPKYDSTVELKSGVSDTIYGKKGNLRTSYSFKLNNSLGTNKKSVLDPKDVADILLVVKNDGAFVVDKQTVIDRSKSNGDGFDVILKKEDIIEISGRIVVDNPECLNIKQRLLDAIRQVI